MSTYGAGFSRSLMVLFLAFAIGCASPPSPDDAIDRVTLRLELDPGFEVAIDGRRQRKAEVKLEPGRHEIEVGGHPNGSSHRLGAGLAPKCRAEPELLAGETYSLKAAVLEYALEGDVPRDAEWISIEPSVEVGPVASLAPSERLTIPCENACRVQAEFRNGHFMSASCRMYPIYVRIREICRVAYPLSEADSVSCEREYSNAMISVFRHDGSIVRLRQ